MPVNPEYPNALRTFADKVDGVTIVLAEHVNTLQAEVASMQGHVGISSELPTITASPTSSTTVTARISPLINALATWATTLQATKVSKTGTETIDAALTVSSLGSLTVPTPTASGHATTKSYVDAANALKVNKSGDSMSGALTIGSQSLSSPSSTMLTVNGRVTVGNADSGSGGDYHALNRITADSRYVNVTGDSMSGTLSVPNATNQWHAINLGQADGRYVPRTGNVTVTGSLNFPVGSGVTFSSGLGAVYTDSDPNWVYVRGQGGARLGWGAGFLSGLDGLSWNLGYNGFLGIAPWERLYTKNSATIVSDVRTKTAIRECTDDELALGNALAESIVSYRKVGAPPEGPDKQGSRYVGLIAQDVNELVVEHGIDEDKYNFALRPEDEDDGLWTISETQILLLICLSQQKKINDLEQRLSALES